VVSGAVASGVLLFCLAVVMAAVFGSSEGAVRYKPQVCVCVRACVRVVPWVPQGVQGGSI
jgi:hypothetical protein